MDSITLYSLGGLAVVIFITLGITGWMAVQIFNSKEEVK